MAKAKNDDDDDKKVSPKLKERDKTPGDVDKDDTSADVRVDDLNEAANRGASSKAQVDVQRKAMEPDRTPLKPGEHLPGRDFRFRVENTAAGDLNMDPREPYPTGNPPDPKEEFYRINGFYPGEGGKGGIAGARDTRGPNPKD